MGKRYFCDYCDRSFQDNLHNRKKHLNGVQHLRAKRAWYDLFRGGCCLPLPSQGWGGSGETKLQPLVFLGLVKSLVLALMVCLVLPLDISRRCHRVVQVLPQPLGAALAGGSPQCTPAR